MGTFCNLGLFVLNTGELTSKQPRESAENGLAGTSTHVVHRLGPEVLVSGPRASVVTPGPHYMLFI